MSCTFATTISATDRFMFRGDSFVFDVQVLQNDCIPQNITGWTIWFTAKFYVSDRDPEAVIRLNNALLGGVVITDAFSGKAEVTVSPTATVNLPDGPVRLVYDVQVKDTLGRIFTIETGTLTVKPDVTRAVS